MVELLQDTSASGGGEVPEQGRNSWKTAAGDQPWGQDGGEGLRIQGSWFGFSVPASETGCN